MTPDADLLQEVNARLRQVTLTYEVYRDEHVILARGYRGGAGGAGDEERGERSEARGGERAPLPGPPPGGEDRVSVLVRVPLGAATGPRALARLRYEHAISRELGLACVVAPLAVEVAGDTAALILKDPGGLTLQEEMRRGRLDVPTALRVASRLAAALDSLHRRNVVHNDLCSHHVIVDVARGSLWLTGLGAATRLPREVVGPGRLDALEVARAYAAPEQTGLGDQVLDRRADLYSFGVVMYEMLTGVLPFQATDPARLALSHLSTTPAAPHDVAPGVPEVLSDLVMKLLSKLPGDRYQSAAGLRADLDQCIARSQANGQTDPFPLGRRDPLREVQSPRQLHGRAAERAAVRAAWDGVRDGAARLLLVSGGPGVGKSALVRELQASVAEAGGRFVSGTLDLMRRNVPYASLADALRALCLQVAPAAGAEPAAGVAPWRSRLVEAVGADGRALTGIVPELGLLLGPQPEIAALPPVEAQRRLAAAVHAVFRVFAAEGPLVLFVDDLQWADAASLSVFQHLVTAPDSGRLLVIGAYRDSELAPARPLSIALQEMRASGALAGEITLRPLDRADVSGLVADAVGLDRWRTEPLATVVFDKTQGNPLFVVQLVRALEAEGLIAFDGRSGALRWDIERIRTVGADSDGSWALQRGPASAVAFVVDRLRRLPSGTREALGFAACVGHRFTLRTLAGVAGQTPAEVAAALWSALREGVVVALSPDYRFFHTVTASGEPPSSASFASSASSASRTADLDVAYRFVHDRAQQAAYALIEERLRQQAHLRLGRLLLAGAEGADGADADHRLFEIVGHMSTGAPLIPDPAERVALARLSLTAGRKARGASAYEAAESYLSAGSSLLGEDGFAREHALAHALLFERAECELLAGAVPRAEELLDALLGHATTEAQRAQVRCLQVDLYGVADRAPEAVRVGIDGLRRLGVDLLDTEAARQGALGAALAEVDQRLAGRRLAALVDAPALTDPGTQAALELMTRLAAPAYVAAPRLFALLVARQVGLSLAYGNSGTSPYAYALYGFLLATTAGRYAEARELGQLAVALNDRFPSGALTCKLNFVLAAYGHLVIPLREVLPYFQRAHEAGLQSGDLVYLSYCCSQSAIARLGLGEPLPRLREQVERYLELMQRTRVATSTAALLIVRQLIASLEGRTRGLGSMSDDTIDEAELVASMEKGDLTLPLCWYDAARLQLLFFCGDYEAALAAFARADERADGVGFYFTTELSFHACLTILSLPRREARGDAARLDATLAAHRAKLAGWARSCPATYLQKHLLVEAEAARAAGDEARAQDGYEGAIAAAKEHGIARDAALAYELGARFHLGLGRRELGRAYLAEASAGLARWGAKARVEHLARAYPDLLDAAPTAAVAAGGAGGSSGIARPALPGDLVATLQALSGELFLDSLLDRFMRVVARSSGAERGFLILEREGALFVEAAITLDPEVVRVGLSTPPAARGDLALSVVQHVARTKASVVFGDPARAGRFAGDPHLVAGRARSIACLVMTHHGRFRGVLYLENATGEDGFGPARIELVDLLLSQAAIAIENALLYARVSEVGAELSRANTTLESEVMRRTVELVTAKDRLERELLEGERAEQERVALHEEILEAHTARVAELSTPLIPITDRIMVMPLIGAMGAARAEQVLDAALQGVYARGAGVMILDITGMKLVDSVVADMLIRMATALGLLGAETVITGIGGAVAQLMVRLEVDFGAVVTRATLQSGIEYALARSGKRLVSIPGGRGS